MKKEILAILEKYMCFILSGFEIEGSEGKRAIMEEHLDSIAEEISRFHKESTANLSIDNLCKGIADCNEKPKK